MRAKVILVTLAILGTLSAQGRPFRIIPPKELIAKSKLVFVGRVNSVRPSGISTSLSYAPWEGARFEWMVAEVRVLEPLKATGRQDIVRVAMLSTESDLMNAPFMLFPEEGDIFLFCVLPTATTNLFAALTGPYNECLSIIPLYRVPSSTDDAENLIKRSSSVETKDLETKLRWHHGRTEPITKLLRDDQHFSPVFGLVNGKGDVLSAGAKRFRRSFAREIAATASSNVVFLEWETAISRGGWRSDVPKGSRARPDPEIFTK
jgi:hypothetical protein